MKVKYAPTYNPSLDAIGEFMLEQDPSSALARLADLEAELGDFENLVRPSHGF